MTPTGPRWGREPATLRWLTAQSEALAATQLRLLIGPPTPRPWRRLASRSGPRSIVARVAATLGVLAVIVLYLYVVRRLDATHM